jgi:hypothetical protein
VHRRVRDREWGDGWLVSGGHWKYNEERFDGDDGVQRLLLWNELRRGTAASILREERHMDKKSDLNEEEQNWTTYFLSDGSIREFRWYP